MRWLHLSDLHFGHPRRHSSEQRTWATLLEHVAQRTRNGLGPDYVLVTGDLTYDGHQSSFTLARAALEELLRVADLPDGRGKWSRVLLVPGNHDVLHPKRPDGEPDLQPAMGRDVHLKYSRPANVSKLLERAYRTLDPHREIRCRGLRLFQRFMGPMFYNRTLTQVGHGSFTYFGILQEHDIGLGVVGMNTAWAAHNTNFENHSCALPCGAALVEEALRGVAAMGAKVVLLLGHHPLRCLYDFASVLQKAHRLNLQLIYLRGHLHKPDWEFRLGEGGECLEIGAGVAHYDLFKATALPHRAVWGRITGDEIEFEPVYQHPQFPSTWSLDTWAFPSHEHQDYRLRVRVGKERLELPKPTSLTQDALAHPHFVGIGLVSLSTICAIPHDLRSENDWKADAVRFWEPEVGTFVALAGAVLQRWDRRVALVTSLGEDKAGREVRNLLNEKGLTLLYTRSVPLTGRQLAITSKGSSTRYIVDRPPTRPRLSHLDRRKLNKLMRVVLQARWLGCDKYELDILEKLVSSPNWARAKTRPAILFETGSRPLPIQAARTQRTRSPRTESLISEISIAAKCDIFTTTAEWVRAAASGIHSRTTATIVPDTSSGSTMLTETTELHPLLERLTCHLMPPGKGKPHAVLITCGSSGCLVVRRAAEAERTYKLHCLAVKETAPMGPGLLGAGDVLRAALIEGLLRQEDTKEQDGRPARHVRQPADILELVSIAQYASYKWLRREPKEDYFGSFPSSYEDLVDEYRRVVDKRQALRAES